MPQNGPDGLSAVKVAAAPGGLAVMAQPRSPLPKQPKRPHLADPYPFLAEIVVSTVRNTMSFLKHNQN